MVCIICRPWRSLRVELSVVVQSHEYLYCLCNQSCFDEDCQPKHGKLKSTLYCSTSDNWFQDGELPYYNYPDTVYWRNSFILRIARICPDTKVSTTDAPEELLSYRDRRKWHVKSIITTSLDDSWALTCLLCLILSPTSVNFITMLYLKSKDFCYGNKCVWCENLFIGSILIFFVIQREGNSKKSKMLGYSVTNVYYNSNSFF